MNWRPGDGEPQSLADVPEVTYCLYCKQRQIDSEVAVGELKMGGPGITVGGGAGHEHNLAVYSRHFSCEAGHQWTRMWRKRCPHYDCNFPLAPDGPGPVPGSGELE